MPRNENYVDCKKGINRFVFSVTLWYPIQVECWNVSQDIMFRNVFVLKENEIRKRINCITSNC